ncbi:MAG: hypothetical protein E6I80_16190 [Chloroflexi bacterium]|nr:MAG: hypothetical protein E6I80_16190 [Chloroflexota bacterium]
MIDGQTTAHKAQFMSVTQYATDLARTGFRVFHGGPGTFWARFNFGGMMRLPRHHVVPPTSDEIQLLRPLANRVTLWGVNTALRLQPEDQRLKKARGLLASILGETPMLEGAVINTNDE